MRGVTGRCGRYRDAATTNRTSLRVAAGRTVIGAGDLRERLARFEAQLETPGPRHQRHAEVAIAAGEDREALAGVEIHRLHAAPADLERCV